MELKVYNVPQMYSEVINLMRINGKREQSRNGPILTIQEPLTVTILNPRERVLFDPNRDANPFFHVMEFVWMMAGQRGVKWLTQFNSRIGDYADDGIMNAAYGHRWRVRWGDQIRVAIELLQRDPTTRQAVIQMWDVFDDAPRRNVKDRACNTTIYFRVLDDHLNMTVCNRSNDIIWGMTGANAVHMTYLHELVANCCDLWLGHYHVMSNNAHFYLDMPNAEQIMDTYGPHDYYEEGVVEPLILDENYLHLVEDCHKMCSVGDLETTWMKEVALPMYRLWFARKDGLDLDFNSIRASDWRLACKQWCERRTLVNSKAGSES